MQTYTGCLSWAPVAKLILLKLFWILFCFLLWIVGVYEKNNMLALIGVTAPTKTTTRLFRRQGAVAKIRRHKTRNHYQQRDKTLTTTTLTTMMVYQQRQELWDANNDNGNICKNIYIIIQSYKLEKMTNKKWSIE